MDLRIRSTSWGQPYNILYFDQPAGTGFSFTKDNRGYATNQFEVANDLYDAMRQFYKMFPELMENELYVTGESYGGKYVPAISYKIHTMNSEGDNPPMPLAGLAIGDGLCDPIRQMDYGDFLFQVGFVDEQDRDTMMNMTEKAKRDIQSQNWAQASQVALFGLL